MEAKAILRTARISPQKARLVADQVRGLPAERAVNLLKFSDKKAAALIKKVVESAIAHRPALLVLDEPTVGLDPEFRLSLRGQLRMLAAESGMLISTHLADDASALCDRVLVLDAGELVFDGTPAALAEHAKANGEEFQAMGSPLERGYASLLAEHRRQAANRATQ